MLVLKNQSICSPSSLQVRIQFCVAFTAFSSSFLSCSSALRIKHSHILRFPHSIAFSHQSPISLCAFRIKAHPSSLKTFSTAPLHINHPLSLHLSSLSLRLRSQSRFTRNNHEPLDTRTSNSYSCSLCSCALSIVCA